MLLFLLSLVLPGDGRSLETVPLDEITGFYVSSIATGDRHTGINVIEFDKSSMRQNVAHWFFHHEQHTLTRLRDGRIASNHALMATLDGVFYMYGMTSQQVNLVGEDLRFGETLSLNTFLGNTVEADTQLVLMSPFDKDRFLVTLKQGTLFLKAFLNPKTHALEVTDRYTSKEHFNVYWVCADQQTYLLERESGYIKREQDGTVPPRRKLKEKDLPPAVLARLKAAGVSKYRSKINAPLIHPDHFEVISVQHYDLMDTLHHPALNTCLVVGSAGTSPRGERYLAAMTDTDALYFDKSEQQFLLTAR